MAEIDQQRAKRCYGNCDVSYVIANQIDMRLKQKQRGQISMEELAVDNGYCFRAQSVLGVGFPPSYSTLGNLRRWHFIPRNVPIEANRMGSDALGNSDGGAAGRIQSVRKLQCICGLAGAHNPFEDNELGPRFRQELVHSRPLRLASGSFRSRAHYYGRAGRLVERNARYLAGSNSPSLYLSTTGR